MRSATSTTSSGPEASRTGGDERHAPVVLARAFGFDLPAGEAVELLAGHVEPVDDHAATVATLPRSEHRPRVSAIASVCRAACGGEFVGGVAGVAEVEQAGDDVVEIE